VITATRTAPIRPMIAAMICAPLGIAPKRLARRAGLGHPTWTVSGPSDVVKRNGIRPPRILIDLVEKAEEAQQRRAQRSACTFEAADNDVDARGTGQDVRAVATMCPVWLPALKPRPLRAFTVPELLAAGPPSAAQLDAAVKGCGAAPLTRAALDR